MTDVRSQTLSRFVGPEKPDSADLGLCVHCGFCLNACPTYLALGVETDSPRGRLYLMRALDEGRIDLTPRVLQHFDQCLQCRACETACPSGVPYGQLMEATRAGLFAQSRTQLGRSLPRRFLWNLIMRRVFPYPGRLRLLGFALRAYQQSGLQRLLRASGLLRLAGPQLAAAEALTPDATQPFFATADVRRYGPRGTPRARVAMLTGCVMPIFHPETHHATVRVLSRNGVEVTAPPSQRCCGALHAHSGDLETARDLARKT
ncbi:MAG: 4Fe-4S dicluster domain-containing protein, partial [Dehalococcoidia bacterium]